MTPATLNLKLVRGITFGPVVITCKNSAGAAVDLTGYTAYAEVRKTSGGTVVIDLAPAISDADAGEVTIPAIEDETTADQTIGDYGWDLILEKPTGERLGPFVAGRFDIRNKITKSS